MIFNRFKLNWGGKQGFPWLKLCPNSSNQFHKYAKLIIKKSKVKLLVAQSCPTLCNPMDVANQVSLFRGFSRQEYRSELPCPSPGNLSDPRIDPRSPVLHVDSLQFETCKTHSYKCSSKSCFSMICCAFIFIYLKVLPNFFDYSGVCYLLSKYI